MNVKQRSPIPCSPPPPGPRIISSDYNRRYEPVHFLNAFVELRLQEGILLEKFVQIVFGIHRGKFLRVHKTRYQYFVQSLSTV